MSTNKLNVNDITRGAMAVLISLIQPKSEKGLTVTQAAKALNISVVALNLMRYHKIGPDYYRDGNRVLYKPSSIMARIPQPNAFTNTNTKKSRAA